MSIGSEHYLELYKKKVTVLLSINQIQKEVDVFHQMHENMQG